MAIFTTGKVRHRGVPFLAAGEKFIIPPITLRQTEELAAFIDDAQRPIHVPDMKSDDGYKEARNSLRMRQVAAWEVVSVAIKRNYPSVTQDDLNEVINTENWGEMFNAAMGLMPNAKKLDNVGEWSPDDGSISTGGTSTGASQQ